MAKTKWLTKNVLLLSLSAFFADSGYQAIIAGLPLFIVLVLKAPVYFFGVAMALAYGGGSAFAYIGGKLADKYNKKKVAILGNSLIPFMSFIGFVVSPIRVIVLFTAGWWSRNFRTPARRAMLSESSDRENRGKAFGFLHALDIGGGFISSLYFIALLYYHIPFRYIFLVSFPLFLISTASLFFVDYKKNGNINGEKTNKLNGLVTVDKPDNNIIEDENKKNKLSERYKKSTIKGIIIATSLYGFSAYSLGFPVLTIAQRLGYIVGIGGYALLSIVSAAAGYYIGSSKKAAVGKLSVLGYMAAAAGSLIMGYAYTKSYGISVFYMGAAVIGLSLGVIETIEPTIISLIAKEHEIGIKMGSLTVARSIGLFFGNIIMGALYMVSPMVSYSYIAFVALSAGIIMLFFGRNYKNS